MVICELNMKPLLYYILLGASVALSGLAPGLPAHAGPAPDSRDFVKPTDDQLRRQLTPLQYEVTQQEGTERAFQNEYWDNKQEGIYVDIVSGEPLFSSTDKFKSGTGWPSLPTHISAMYSVTARNPPACATASIPHHCGSFRKKSLPRKDTVSISNCSGNSAIRHGLDLHQRFSTSPQPR